MVYNNYCNKVYSIAYYVVKDEYDAEDIMQEVFISLPKKVETLKSADAFESWLFRITKNKAIDFQRKTKNINFSELDGFGDNDDFIFEETIKNENRDFSPEESLDYHETQRIVQGIIDSLPKEQRECIILRFKYGLTLQEISNKTGASLPTVKSRLKYGKAKIESEVKEYEKNGTRLHGISVVSLIPFIRWIFGNDKSFSYSLAMKSSNDSTIVASSIVSDPTKVSIGTKFATLSTGAKMTIVSITSVAIISGGIFAMNFLSHQENTDYPNDYTEYISEISYTEASELIATNTDVNDYVTCISEGTLYLGNLEWNSDKYKSFDKFDYHVPKIFGITSSEVDTINQEFEDIVNNIKASTDIFESLPENKTILLKLSFDYSAWITNIKDSLILTIKTINVKKYSIDKKFYSIDINTGKKLLNDDILKLANITEEESVEIQKRFIEEYFQNERATHPENSHIYDENCEQRTKEKIKTKEDIIDFWVDFENGATTIWGDGRTYYFNEDGKLCTLVEMHINATPGPAPVECVLSDGE